MKTLKILTLPLLGLCVFLSPLVHPQELHHVTGVINVEVPVRVFDGGKFIDDLTLKDFEVFENGNPQKIVALYLVRKEGIQKEEMSGPEAAKPAPKTKRTIVMQFEVLHPMPKLDEAVDFFFNEVLQPDDSLIVITPRTTYRFKPEALARLPRQQIAGQLKSKLRKDVLAGATEYRRLVREFQDILLRTTNLDPDLQLFTLQHILGQLRDRVGIDEAGLRQTAQSLKALEGQKYIFMFYEKEMINSISLGNFNSERLDQSERNLDDMAQADLRRDLTFDPKLIEKSFSDASITVHFIYLTQPSQVTSGFDVQNQLRNEDLETKDLSSSLYMSFREMARATGGVSEASANPFASFRKAATAMENYYLLYYVPENYRADGKFRETKVEVKGKRFQVTHRAGYFAN